MSKEQTLSQRSDRVSFKELQQIIKMGLVQGNLIPAFLWCLVGGCDDKSFLPIVNTSNSLNVDWFNINYGWRLCIK